MKTNSVLVMLSCIFITIAAYAGEPLSWSAELANTVDQEVKIVMERNNVPGATLAIAIKGELVYTKAYGIQEIKTFTPVNTETLFQIGSVSKQFVAASIMYLQEQNKLNIDDKLSVYFSDVPHADQITLRNLLSHTSGLAGYTEAPNFQFVAKNPTTPEEIVALTADQPLIFMPGTQWGYSNTNYVLLAMIVTKVSGIPYHDFVRSQFFNPIGLTRSLFFNEDIAPNTAGGYTNYVMGAPYEAEWIHSSWLHGAGDLAMTASELVKWNIALTTGKLVSKDSYEKMATQHVLSDGKKASYGLGLQIKNDKHIGKKVLYHGGGIYGYRSENWTIPVDGVSVVLIGNSGQFTGIRSAMNAITAAVYGLPRKVIQFSADEDNTALKDHAKNVIRTAFSGELQTAYPGMTTYLTPQNMTDLVTLGQKVGELKTLELYASESRPPLLCNYYRATFDREVLDYVVCQVEKDVVYLDFTPWFDY